MGGSNFVVQQSVATAEVGRRAWFERTMAWTIRVDGEAVEINLRADLILA